MVYRNRKTHFFKFWNCLAWGVAASKFLWPLYKWTKMFRLFGSWYSNRPAQSHGFNAKICFEKYAPSPKLLPKNCPKSAFQTKPAKLDTFSLISQDYFSKPFFALKQWDWVVQFEYHEPYNLNDFFPSLIKASEKFWGSHPQAKKSQNSKSRVFSVSIYHWAIKYE